MVYICENCGFIFNRLGEIEECPTCEAKHIRSATEEETLRLQELLEQEQVRKWYYRR